MKYIFTPSGRVTAVKYIRELSAKRKEILEACKDTVNETSIPTIGDILADIEAFGLDITGEYINGWGVTDNYDADYPLILKLNEDFCEREYELTDAGRDKLSAYLDRTAKKQKLCIEKAMDTADKTIIPLPDEVLCEIQEEYYLGDKVYDFRQNIADDTYNPEFCTLKYGEDFVVCAEGRNFVTDKKLNAAYWDKIDAIVERFVNEIAILSVEPFKYDVYDDGIVPEIREVVIASLAERGGSFPYVDECM